MALNTQVNTAPRNAATDAMCALANSGKLQAYDSTGTGQPAAGGAVTTQVKLIEWTLPNPAFGASSAGTATANTISAVNPTATGTATWFRVLSSASAILWDGSIGTSAANLILGNTTIATGVSQAVTSFTHATAANAIAATY